MEWQSVPAQNRIKADQDEVRSGSRSGYLHDGYVTAESVQGQEKSLPEQKQK